MTILDETQPNGWLTNPERKMRRDNANTFTSKDAQFLIDKIDSITNYVSPTLISDEDRTLDTNVRARDKAIIAIGYIFFKRGGEILGLRLKEIEVTDRELIVTFFIEKKRKRLKYCPECNTKNGIKSKFCKECKTGLSEVPITYEGEPLIRPKRKTLRNKFTKYILDWFEILQSLTDNPDALFFPPLQVVFNSAYFDFNRKKPMTIQNLDRLLQRLDPTMTSSLFRYGGTERYLNLGYTPSELKEIGDWSSSRMPEIYAERKGITAAQRRWSEDTS